MTRRAQKWSTIWVCVLAIGATGAIAWLAGVKWQFIPRRWEQVDPGVYRSAAIAPRLVKPTWQAHSIKVVVVLGRDKPGRDDQANERSMAQELGVERVVFPLDGKGTGAPASYVGALTCIIQARREGKPVVVHCTEGIHRTGGVVALYRVLVDGWSGPAAYAELMTHRVPADSPLIPYLNQHVGEIAQALVDQGALDRIPHPLPVFSAEALANDPRR